MVDFIVFNELSLPFQNNIEAKKEFNFFLLLIEEFRKKDLKRIRTTENFKNYQILDGIYLQQFFNSIRDEVLKRKILSFMNNGFIILDSPLIKDEEIVDNEESIINEYFYKGKSTFGGLACCDIWDTIAISFNSRDEWDKNIVILQKNQIDIQINHASKVEHLKTYKNFFNKLKENTKRGITQSNFWERREEFFSKKIIFCKEVEKQIKTLDKTIFQQAITILRDIETDKKLITDYNYSGESQSVKDDKELKKLRYFTIDDKKVYFDNHIKSLSNANRIYFIQQDNVIYIGYIGKHLPTKKFK